MKMNIPDTSTTFSSCTVVTVYCGHLRHHSTQHLDVYTSSVAFLLLVRAQNDAERWRQQSAKSQSIQHITATGPR